VFILKGLQSDFLQLFILRELGDFWGQGRKVLRSRGREETNVEQSTRNGYMGRLSRKYLL